MKQLLIILFLLPSLTSCGLLVVGSAATVGIAATEERTVGQMVDDTAISTEINHYFLQKDIDDLFSNVSVIVREGRVLLTGRADTHETAVNAVRLSWQATGVKEVINELVVTKEGGLMDRARDEWLEKRIEAKMLITKGIHLANYSVEVSDMVVYLLGVAENEEEMKILLAVARTTSGVKKVVSHVRLPLEAGMPPNYQQVD